MNIFDALLSQIKQKVDTEGALKQVVCTVIADTIHTTISIDNIKLKDGILTFSVSPTLKSLILLKKETLLEVFQKKDIPVRTIR